MLLVVTLASGLALRSLRAPTLPVVARRALAPRCDSDRCYYGEVDAAGNVLRGKQTAVERGPVPKPSPSLSPEDVVDAQFNALSRGAVQNREGVSGVDDAFQFVSPTIVSLYDMDVARYKAILEGPAYEGLIGCSEMQVLGTEVITDAKVVVSLRVLPKPVTGCVRMSGVADQSGITWWTHYKWHLLRESEGSMTDCWMVEQMFPAPPPIDATSRDATPQMMEQTAEP